MRGPIGNHPAGRHLWTDADDRLVEEMCRPKVDVRALLRTFVVGAACALIVAGVLLGLMATPLSGWTIAAGLLIATGTGLLVRLASAATGHY